MALFSLCCSNEFSRGNAQIADLVLFFLKTKSLFYAFSPSHISPGKSRTPYTLYTGFFFSGGGGFVLFYYYYYDFIFSWSVFRLLTTECMISCWLRSVFLMAPNSDFWRGTCWLGNWPFCSTVLYGCHNVHCIMRYFLAVWEKEKKKKIVYAAELVLERSHNCVNEKRRKNGKKK